MAHALAPSPSPWPAPAGADTPWGFERPIAAERPGEGGAQEQVQRWVLASNCSITPRQMGAFYLALCTLSFAVAALFWWQGARIVSLFSGIELLAVGAALLVHARHAGDREIVTLAGERLEVEQQCGLETERTEFDVRWLHIEAPALVELSAAGRRLSVGRFVRPELREAFAWELRRALQRARQPATRLE